MSRPSAGQTLVECGPVAVTPWAGEVRMARTVRYGDGRVVDLVDALTPEQARRIARDLLIAAERV